MASGSPFKLAPVSFWHVLLVIWDFLYSLSQKDVPGSIFYFPCPNPGISHFYKVPRVLLCRMEFRNQDLVLGVLIVQDVIASSPCQWTELEGKVYIYTFYICFNKYIYIKTNTNHMYIYIYTCIYTCICITFLYLNLK